MACEHFEFDACVNVARITAGEGGPVERYQADIRIECRQCKTPMRFVGLPAGVDLTGAATSVDATEARLTIHPKGEVLSELEGTPIGFSVRKRI